MEPELLRHLTDDEREMLDASVEGTSFERVLISLATARAQVAGAYARGVEDAARLIDRAADGQHFAGQPGDEQRLRVHAGEIRALATKAKP